MHLRILTLGLFFLALWWVISPVQANEPMYFFYGTGCPHCHVVEEYFDQQNILELYPVEVKEIYFDRENTIFYNKTMDQLGVPANKRGVPALVVGDQVIVGDTPIIDYFLSSGAVQLTQPEKGNLGSENIQAAKTSNYSITLLAVIGASLVDAINPCAFAVLIILMTTILATGGGRRALFAGLAFASSIFISYLLMGLGLYQALGLSGLSSTFFTIIGWLAIFLGLFNLKDFFWYGRGFLMEVPLSWRPKLKKLINSVTNPLGAFGIGFLVSLFLLPCTSGPYIVILGMLAQKTQFMTALGYLILYNLIFIFPMVLITVGVYQGLNPQKLEKIRQKQLRTLHLIAGLILLVMGVAILAGWG